MLPNIIHHNHTGYVKDRVICEIIRSILCYGFHCQGKHPKFLLFIDFQKAFDSVERTFHIESIKKFNFGPDLPHWVKTPTTFKALL